MTKSNPFVKLEPAAISPQGRDVLGLSACAVVALLLVALSWFQLGSVDLGYHVAYGRHFLDTGKIVEVDPFLYPENARPFVNANWGSQVVMAIAERAAGASGLIVLRTLLLALIFTCVALLVRWRTDGLHWIAWAWVLAALAAYERFTLRPELFSYALMMLVLAVLVFGVASWREISALGLVQLAWVNAHSYFLIGLMLTGAFLLGQLWAMFRSRGRDEEIRATDRRRLRMLAIALGVQIVACCVNPWLHHGALFPIQTLGYLKSAGVMGGAEGWSGESAWSAISEFKSPFAFLDQPINQRTIHTYLVLLLVCVLGLVAMLVRGMPGPALAVLMLLVMSTQMRRNIAQFALVAAPFCMIAFAGLQAWSPEVQKAARRVRAALLLATILLSVFWIHGIVDGRFYFVERRINRVFGIGYNPRIFPVDAVNWLASQEAIQPNLYVNYFASSNTLPWLPPRFKLYVNTNTFAYREETLATAYRLGLGQEDHTQVFNRHHVNAALLHCGSDTQLLVRRLTVDQYEWALVYFDRHAVIFVRRIQEHVPLIRANMLTEADLDAKAWIEETRGSASQRAMDLAIAAGVPISLGWHRPAIVLCEEAVRLAPDYYEAWQYLAVCHGNLGNEAAKAERYDEAIAEYEKALECFGRVLEQVPEHPEAMNYAKITVAKIQEVQTRKSMPALPNPFG